MPKLYIFGVGLFAMTSYYTMAKAYNVQLKYDPKELLQKHTGVDANALLEAGTSTLSQQMDNIAVQLERVRGVELQKMSSIVGEEVDKFSQEVANLFK